MSISSDGILAFGFDLGIEDERPGFLGDNEEDDLYDLIAKEAGIGEWNDGMTDKQSAAYFKRKNMAVAACPVELVMHCSWEYPMYVIAVRGTVKNASRGNPIVIDAASLEVSAERIESAKVWCANHGVEWKTPEWVLCSIYG